MTTYHVTLTIAGDHTESADFEDKLFEAGCDDATICYNGKTAYIEFDRESDTAHQAVATAIDNIESAGYKVAHSDQAGYVTLSAVAYLSGTPIKTIRAYANGDRGKRLNSEFPAPHFGLSSGSVVYYWPEVAEWLVNNNKLDASFLEVAKAIVELTKKGQAAA